MKSLLLSTALFFAHILVAQESNTIKYGNLLEFQIPEKYELRTNSKINEDKDKILKELDFKGSKSQYILQPKGMNDISNKIKFYSRILVKIEYGNFDTNQKTREYSKEFLGKLGTYFTSTIEKMPNTQVLKTSSVSKINLKNKNFIDFECISKINQDPEILDRTLTFMDKTYLIRFTISYRVTEEEYWNNDIHEFLNSIIIKDNVVKKVLPQKQQNIQKKKLTPMQLKVLQDSKNSNNDASIRSMQSIK